MTINTKDLQNRLLDVAFSGQLSNNTFSDEKFLKEINNYHKEISNYQEIEEKEKLIQIPSNWVWSRLKYVTKNHGTKTPKNTFCYIDVSAVDNEKHLLKETINEIDYKNAPSRARKITYNNDVLYSTVRPYLHNICIVDRNFSFEPIASTAFCVMSANKEFLDYKYLYYWLLCKSFDKFSCGDPSRGVLYPAINESELLNGVIPLCSIKEQKQIVHIIESITEEIYKINSNKEKMFDNYIQIRNKIIKNVLLNNTDTQDLTQEYVLEQVLDYVQPNDYQVEEIDYDNTDGTPVLTPGKSFVKGYTDDTDGIYNASENPIIIFDDFTTMSKYVDFDFKVKSSALKILINKNDNVFYTKYIYYLMQTLDFDSTNHKRYWIRKYSKQKVNIPDINIQKRKALRIDVLLNQLKAIETV